LGVANACRACFNAKAGMTLRYPARDRQQGGGGKRRAFSSACAAGCVHLDRRRSGSHVIRLSPADTDALIRRDVERWTKLIKEAGISAGQ
jgi:hypothetical protein